MMKATQAVTAGVGRQPDPDVRVCRIGNSFVAGVGDERHLGWAGRLAAHSHARGQALTDYNVGIRRDTSAGVLPRVQSECTPRLPSGSSAGIVLSFGVDDTMNESGAPWEARHYRCDFNTKVIDSTCLGSFAMASGGQGGGLPRCPSRQRAPF